MSIPSVATTIIIKNCPERYTNCEFNESDSTFAIKQIPIPEKLLEGTCLVKTLLLSNDPHQRLSIQKNQELGRSYAAPLVPGDIMTSLGIVEIVKSNSKKYHEGQIVIGLIRWADYAILSDTVDLHQPIKQPLEYPLEYYLSIFGITGLAAYFGLVDVGKVRKGSVVVVSAASGASGSMAIQISKNILGASKVIGITGSDSKCKFVEKLGADICFNYHDPNWKQEFSQYTGTEFVDVFFDCAGGEILSFLLTKIKKGGRVAVCGSITGFNDKSSGKITNWNEVITNTITLQGFLVFDYQDRFLEGATVLVEAVKSGKIKTSESAFHVETLNGNDMIEKMKQIPKIWQLLFTNHKPNGKLITKVT